MDTREFNGERYISCDVLIYGDYGGAGSVGKANVDWIKEHMEDALIVHGAYYSCRAWLPDTEENRELIKGLEESYPCIDDEHVSRVELEWEEKAWSNYVRKDLLKGLPDDLGEVITDDLTDSDLYQIYRQAMEEEQEYPIAEYNGVYIWVDRIQETFNRLVLETVARL